MTHTQTTCPSKMGARPTEFGALGSVFEKSGTELKLKQKLLKYKHTLQIATFDVRILNRIGQLPELTTCAIYYNIDITYKKKQNPQVHSWLEY